MGAPWNTAGRRTETTRNAPVYLHLGHSQHAETLLSKQKSGQDQEQILSNWQKFRTSKQHDQNTKKQPKKQRRAKETQTN